MIVMLLDIMSFITIGLMTIPAWISFLLDSIANFGTTFAPE